MQTVYLSLGSNIGDRQWYLHEAVKRLTAHSAILLEISSKFYETSPVGQIVQDDFINQVIKIQTTLAPLELLDHIHQIETELGRTREIHWGPRTIDIDILFFEGVEMSSEVLVVPHKEIFNRLFVLVPLLEILDERYINREKIQSAILRLELTEQKVQIVEEESQPQARIETAVREILLAVGENPEREGLLETPTRAAKMYAEILSSQRKTRFDEYKNFKIEQAETDQMVLVKDIEFYSMCEHHMLPFFGKVHVAYLPQNGNIIGLSKIPRLVDFVSKRLSVQENITRDIAEILQEILQPKGIAVLVEARHMCVEMRGVKKAKSNTTTSFYLGEFDENSSKREEFLSCLK